MFIYRCGYSIQSNIWHAANEDGVIVGIYDTEADAFDIAQKFLEAFKEEEQLDVEERKYDYLGEDILKRWSYDDDMKYKEKYIVIVGKLGQEVKDYVFPGTYICEGWSKEGIDDLLKDYTTNLVDVGSTVTREED